MAAINAKVGSLALNTSTGNQVITGLNFQPKLILFLSEPSTSDITADVANMHISIGGATTGHQFCVGNNSRNGVSSSATASIHTESHIIFIADPPGSMTADYSVDFVSMDADGFTLNVNNAPPAAYKFGYLALGGDDIVNVSSGRFSSKGSTGAQALTGLGFQPDVLIFVSAMGFNNPQETFDEARFGIGFATATDSFSLGYFGHDAQNPQASRKRMNSGNIFMGMSSTGGGGIATLTSMDADGFTLNWAQHSSAVNWRIYYIALKFAPGVSAAVGSVQLPASVSSVFINGLSFLPGAGIFISDHHSALTDTIQNHVEFSVGLVGQEDERYMIGGQDETGVSPTDTGHYSHSQKIMRNMDTAGAVEEDVDIASWQGSGAILDSEVALATPSYLGYLLIGPTVEGGSGGGGGGGDNTNKGFLLNSLL